MVMMLGSLLHYSRMMSFYLLLRFVAISLGAMKLVQQLVVY